MVGVFLLHLCLYEVDILFLVVLIYADYSGVIKLYGVSQMQLQLFLWNEVSKRNGHKSKRNTATNEDKRLVFGLLSDNCLI